MAGYGNRTNPDLNPSDFTDQHDSTRLGRDDSHAYSGGHDTYGSGATGGAGFGNKSNSDSDPAASNSEFRFGSHGETAPYSGKTHHGSGTVGGAGYGNKTGGFAPSHDSTMGKIMEKAGNVMHSDGLAEKGRAKREAQGFGKTEE